MSILSYQRPMISKGLPNLNPWLYTMAGDNVRSYHKPHPKPKTIVDLQETLQMI